LRFRRVLQSRLTLSVVPRAQAPRDGVEAQPARYALKHGMPGGGYIFSTSNCVYTGMKLERYETMLDVWRQIGNYPEAKKASFLKNS